MLIPHLELLTLLIDFGLVVLILMVQLTIYPSFKYFEKVNLISWHQQYTGQIAIVVAPLMISQVAIASYIVYESTTILVVAKAILVIGTWITTFLLFVPIHNRISNSKHSDQDLENIVKRNWIRVILWITIFLIELSSYF